MTVESRGYERFRALWQDHLVSTNVQVRTPSLRFFLTTIPIPLALSVKPHHDLPAVTPAQISSAVFAPQSCRASSELRLHVVSSSLRVVEQSHPRSSVGFTFCLRGILRSCRRLDFNRPTPCQQEFLDNGLRDSQHAIPPTLRRFRTPEVDDAFDLGESPGHCVVARRSECRRLPKWSTVRSCVCPLLAPRTLRRLRQSFFHSNRSKIRIVAFVNGKVSPSIAAISVRLHPCPSQKSTAVSRNRCVVFPSIHTPAFCINSRISSCHVVTAEVTSIFPIPKNILAFTLEKFSIEHRVEMLTNRSPVFCRLILSQPSRSAFPFELYGVTDRNASRNHEFDE